MSNYLPGMGDFLIATGPLCGHCGGARTGDRPVIKSDGMGVESVAITLEWLANPDSRDFCLCQLIVITAQTGDEHDDTIRLMEQHILPLYRAHNIRFVEVARAGHHQSDGIVILQDTRQPVSLHREGAYKLSDELKAGGTVPQFGGEHRCALKFKAFVIETWLEQFYKPIRFGFNHVFGYNADETSRADKCTAATCRRNAVLTDAVFGFNADETGRAERAAKYDADSQRRSVFPLIEWGWSRADCEDFILQQTGVVWPKSACVYCPFNREASKQTAKGLDRLAQHPAETADALLVEHLSLAMNPRGALYDKTALREIVNEEAAGLFNARIDAMQWSLYRVRRIYSRKGKADRCVEVVMTGSREFMTERLRRLGAVTEQRGIEYVYRHRRDENVYPATEEFYVTAPASMQTKARYGVPKFNGKWAVLHQEEGATC